MPEQPPRSEGNGEWEEDLASTSNDDRVTPNDEGDSQPRPQGGKGTPSQAEGDDEDSE